jgi:hypothetical protein
VRMISREFFPYNGVLMGMSRASVVDSSGGYKDSHCLFLFHAPDGTRSLTFLSSYVSSCGRYWETVESLRRMFLSGLVALVITGQLSQTLASLAVSVLYLRAYIAFRPYTRFSDNMVRSKQLVSSRRPCGKRSRGEGCGQTQTGGCVVVYAGLGPCGTLIQRLGSRRETRSHPLSCLSNDLVLHTSTVV